MNTRRPPTRGDFTEEKQYVKKVLILSTSLRGGSNSEIIPKVKNADTIIFATPIYYYEMSGQMKTLLDRLNPLFPTDYAFREIYMIATAAEEEESTFEKAYSGLQGWVDCFEKAELKGLVADGGINDAGTAGNYEEVMEKAFVLGKGL